MWACVYTLCDNMPFRRPMRWRRSTEHSWASAPRPHRPWCERAPPLQCWLVTPAGLLWSVGTLVRGGVCIKSLARVRGQRVLQGGASKRMGGRRHTAGAVGGRRAWLTVVRCCVRSCRRVSWTRPSAPTRVGERRALASVCKQPLKARIDTYSELTLR